ncbi:MULTISPECIES: phage tail protein [Chryseobacterium]|uniref:Phage tail protein n=2 Tax=Chryseobacterium TaxID=59732 RepID=A0A202C606_9FLAO|nr:MULTISPECIES: tail fiber protein [Chryseobacterium]MDO3426712.1 tail fiber protein [Chryseobacterium sp. APV1]OVE59128.1 phage tail protein [Chryseobacterium mucoviscidosis]HAO09131.1 phage tail protein [Chryseobacterium sp.]
MDDELMGVVKVFAGNFAPRGYMFCNGALLSIAQYSALFSLLGTTYGGDGIRTFALPNLNGRTPIGQGNSNTGRSYTLGEVGGTIQNTLLSSNLPSFASQLKVSSSNATTSVPTANTSIAVSGIQAGRDFTAVPSFVDAAPNTVLYPQSVVFTGQNLPVNNMPPYLGINYIICVEGIYPSRP